MSTQENLIWAVEPVIFRVYSDGTVFALFPAYPASADGRLVTCYQHVGGHCGADLAGCIKESRPATPDEYASLKLELEGSPYRYRLKVYKRATRGHYLALRASIKKLTHTN